MMNEYEQVCVDKGDRAWNSSVNVGETPRKQESRLSYRNNV